MTASVSARLAPYRGDGGVCFTFSGDPALGSVAVAGTFNSWVGDRHPLTRIGPATWRITLAIGAGRHHYKYVLDGRDWVVDPANPWRSEDAQNNSSFTVEASGAVLIRPGAVSARRPAALHQRAALASPAWLADAVIYQLSVRAFGATFDGVRARLDYLVQLGVNTLWLMPLQPTGLRRRRGTLGDPYAVRDFNAIDPALGDAAGLRALVDAAHQRGMRVLLDWPLNRSSCDNVLTRRHPDWYTRDARGRIHYAVPNRDDCAGFDFTSPALRAWLIASMRGWLRDFDLDGFRFDDADITPLDVLEQIRAALAAERPQLALIAHSCDEFHHLAACDLTYDGALRELALAVAAGQPAASLRHYWEESVYSFPRGALRLRWLEEKEQDRAWRHFGPGLHLAAAALVLTLDGVPHLLMGQEFNEPRWRNWTMLFEDVALDWNSFEQASFDHYRALIGLRARHPALRQGEVEFLEPPAPACVMYRRHGAREVLQVIVNLGQQALALPMRLARGPVLYARGLESGADGRRSLDAFGCMIVSLPCAAWRSA